MKHFHDSMDVTSGIRYAATLRDDECARTGNGKVRVAKTPDCIEANIGV